jgi:putative sigma-54 modulation protein
VLIEFTGRHTEVTPRLRALAERKLKKISRTLHGITRAHVILTRDKHRQIVEVTVQSRRLTLAAQGNSADPAASLGAVMDRLARQAQRHVARRREIKRGNGAAPGTRRPREA